MNAYCQKEYRIKKKVNGYSNLASNKRKKKEKDICCFVIKRAKKTQKRKAIYIQILVQIHESYLHTYLHTTTYTYLHVGKSNNEKAQQMSFLSNTVQSTPILHMCI